MNRCWTITPASNNRKSLGWFFAILRCQNLQCTKHCCASPLYFAKKPHVALFLLLDAGVIYTITIGFRIQQLVHTEILKAEKQKEKQKTHHAKHDNTTQKISLTSRIAFQADWAFHSICKKSISLDLPKQCIFFGRLHALYAVIRPFITKRQLRKGRYGWGSLKKRKENVQWASAKIERYKTEYMRKANTITKKV